MQLKEPFFKGIFSVISHKLPCLATTLIYLLLCPSELVFTGEAVNQRFDGEYQRAVTALL